MAATIVSLLALWLGGAHEATMVTPGGEMHFHQLRVWRYSEGRQEQIPALSATLENRTGREWAQVRVRVHAACPEGGRSYDVRLRNIRPGAQAVAETAFDAIGTVAACEESAARVEYIDGRAGEPPTYVVLGFAHEFGESGWSTELEGLLDHRRPESGQSMTRRLYWRDSGEKLHVRDGVEPVAFYKFRTEPGEFGLAGFTLTRDEPDSGTLSRFLRFYRLPAGKTSYLGVFRVFRGQGSEAGVRIEFDPQAFEWLQRREPGVVAPAPQR